MDETQAEEKEMILELKKDLLKLSDKEKSRQCAKYFKTGEGEYAEGDLFLGVSCPDQRKIAKKYRKLDLDDLGQLISSPFHEHRQVALFILVEKFQNGNGAFKKEIFDFYLKNTKYINNWDLVDLSSHKIVGAYLFDKDRKILYALARSNNLWEKRIAIISTAYFISQRQFKDTLKISEILLRDKHDLIHKAVGWMLREVGKRNKGVEEEFLSKYYLQMPRTMLRYAIEKFSDKEKWMKKNNLQPISISLLYSFFTASSSLLI